MEKRLVMHADYRQTVSTGLADIMAAEYGVPFACLPNCEPAKHAKIFAPRPSDPAHVKFLFQGGFSAHRGIALLIEAWKDTDERAILILRGPERWYKTKMVELATRTGLLGTRIFFPPPVAESELIDAACEADVGLIPYEPFGMNHKHCCPNKTSQYMAAGLPILANNTDYVSSIVAASGAGIVINFAHKKQLIEAVERFIAEPELRVTLGRAGNDYFHTHFNWDVQSKSFYEALQKMIEGSEKEKLRYYESSLPFASAILKAAPMEITQPIPDVALAPVFDHRSKAQRAWHRLPVWLRRTAAPAVGTVKNVIGLDR
jgi:glycosyltransferase involved in cell wall biosynthesis